MTCFVAPVKSPNGSAPNEDAAGNGSSKLMRSGPELGFADCWGMGCALGAAEPGVDLTAAAGAGTGAFAAGAGAGAGAGAALFNKGFHET